MERFKDFLTDYERRGKISTAKAYKSVLNQFNLWLQVHGNQDNFDDKDVIVFLDNRPEWSDQARNLLIIALRGWAKQQKARVPAGITLEEMQRGREAEKRFDRLIAIKGYTVHVSEKIALTLDQLKKLFVAMDADTATLFWILVWFGVRLNELKRIERINWEQKYLVIGTEKTPGHRTLYFDDYTAKLLHHAIESGLLAWHGQKIWARLKYYSTEIEPIKLTPHLARHCFASFFAPIINTEFPGDRDTLRIMLGHTPADVTGIYIHSARIRDLMQNKHFLKPLEPKVE